MMTRSVKLSDLFKIGSSKRVLKSQWQKSGIPFYRGREITKLSADGFVDNELFITETLYSELSNKHGAPAEGDIVITAIGTIGNSYIVQKKDKFYFKDASVLWLKRTSDVSSDYVNWWLKSSLMKDQLDNGNGATVDTLTIKKLQSLVIDLPSSAEQKRIVTILDQAFAEIEQARALAEKNLNNARELFESYLQQVFSQRGEGWVEQTLGETVVVERGSSPRPIKKYQTTSSDGVNWIKIGDAKEGQKYITSTKEKITKEGATKSRFVDVGDFILSNSMSFGRPYIMKIQGYIHDGWFVLRLPKEVDSDYFYYLLSSPYLKSQFHQLAAGAIVKNISGDLVKKAVLPIPPIEKQKKIALEIAAITGKTELLEVVYQKKLTALDELKKSILKQAFSGQLTSKEAA